MDTEKKESSRFPTIFAGCITLPLPVLMLFILLHVPVLSVPAFRIVPYMPLITLIVFLLAAVDLLLWRHKKTLSGKIIFCLALAGFLACLIIDASELIVAKKQNVPIDLSAAFLPDDGDVTYDGDVAYLNYEGRDYVLSLWLPKDTDEKKAPVLLWVHGGGWTSGSNHDAAAHCRFFSEHGYLVASVEYPLSGNETHLYTIQQGAVAKAVQWLKYHASSFGGDISRLYLGGSSAGGNLAIATAARINKGELDAVLGETLPKIKAVSTCYPPVDPAKVYNGCDPVFRSRIHTVCTQNWGGSPKDVPERYAESTAAVLMDESMAPTLILYGQLDHLIPASSYKSFVNRMKEYNIGLRTIVFPFSDHGCDLSGSIECQVWRQRTLEWFEQYQ